MSDQKPSTRRVKVEVTKRDIRLGCHNGYECPITRAVRRAARKRDVFTERRRVLIGDARAQLPLDAIDFIYRFDRDEPVEPFSFEIEVSE